VRLGAFHQQLVAWSEKACVLTVTIPSVGSELRFAGILRTYFSLDSMRGWTLVPPQQHGGFETMRLTQLNIDEMTRRRIVGAGACRRLLFSADGETRFALERDAGAALTAPPRATRHGRYLYIGGRRRQRPEAWMLQ
jgi:hypothetical protein